MESLMRKILIEACKISYGHGSMGTHIKLLNIPIDEAIEKIRKSITEEKSDMNADTVNKTIDLIDKKLFFIEEE